MLSFTGQCPSDWTECPLVVLRSKISLTHTNALDSSRVQFEIYQKATVDRIIDSLHDAMTNSGRILSLGIESAMVEYNVVLTGVPNDVTMDEVQIQYFEATTKLFLDEFTGNFAVFSVEVNNQDSKIGNINLRRKLAEKGIVELNGLVRGAYPTGTAASNFKEMIEKAFRKDSDTYIHLLKQNTIRPGDINDGERISYFQGITEISSRIIDTEKQSSIHKLDSSMGAKIFGIVGGFCALVGIYLLFRHIRTERKKRNDLAKYREQRREERRARRLERFTRQLSVESIDASGQCKTMSNASSCGSADLLPEKNIEEAKQRIDDLASIVQSTRQSASPIDSTLTSAARNEKCNKISDKLNNFMEKYTQPKMTPHQGSSSVQCPVPASLHRVPSKRPKSLSPVTTKNVISAKLRHTEAHASVMNSTVKACSKLPERSSSRRHSKVLGEEKGGNRLRPPNAAQLIRSKSSNGQHSTETDPSSKLDSSCEQLAPVTGKKHHANVNSTRPLSLSPNAATRRAITPSNVSTTSKARLHSSLPSLNTAGMYHTKSSATDST
jgi:hypothetical protein